MKFKKGDIVKYRSENWIGMVVQYRPKYKDRAFVRWIWGPWRGLRPTTMDLKNLTMHDVRRNYEI